MKKTIKEMLECQRCEICRNHINELMELKPMRLKESYGKVKIEQIDYKKSIREEFEALFSELELRIKRISVLIDDLLKRMKQDETK